MFNESVNLAEKAGRGYCQLPETIPMPSPGESKDGFARRLVKQYGPTLAYLIEGESYLRYDRFVEPEFETTPEQRKRLRTEGGVAFANHPSQFDLDLLLRALQDDERKVRDDFIVLRNPNDNEYKRDVSIFGSEHFRVTDGKDARPVFDEVADRIKAGALFIIFPSYRSERQGDRLGLQFENGLAYIISALPPDKMVYSFGINRAEVQDSRLLGQKKVRISEHCFNAGDWQESFRDHNRNSLSEKSSLLLKVFEAAHSENLSGYRIGMRNSLRPE